MWSHQVDDYSQFLCPSLVYHQELDLCHSPREACFTLHSPTTTPKMLAEAPIVSKSLEPTNMTPPSDPPEFEPVTSLNDLTGFSAPQTLKLIGYINHRKVIILVDSGSHHNFIHRRITQ
jgi:hypothetical protein